MSARITVAQLAVRTDALEELITGLATAQAQTNELLTKLVSAQAQASTPAPVVDLAEAKAAKASRKGATTRKTVSLKTAQKRVDEGADAWKDVFVKSSTTGEPIPYGLVLRAQKAQARTSEPKATNAPKSAPKSNRYFGMSRKDLLADGSKGAQAEIARRDAKKAAKTA